MRLDIWTKTKEDRGSFIGGSDARIIMGDDEAALLRLWREKRGEVEPEDLSGNLIVQLGTVTERLNRHWYERNTGQVVTEVQQRVFYAGRDRTAETCSGVDRTVAEAAARHRVIEDPFHRGDAPAVRVRPPRASWNAGAATSSEAEGANRRAHGNGRADAAPSPC
jgi:hypothetical protein